MTQDQKLINFAKATFDITGTNINYIKMSTYQFDNFAKLLNEAMKDGISYGVAPNAVYNAKEDGFYFSWNNITISITKT